MNDNQLYSMIRSSVLEEAPRKDFDDVKRRIAMLDRSDAQPVGSVIEPDFFSGKTRIAPGRILAAAAAVVVAVGVGYAVLSSGLSLSHMKTESAAETADAAPVMYEDAFEPAAETTTANFAAAEESGSFDGIDEDMEADDTVSDSDRVSASDAVPGRALSALALSKASAPDSSTAEAEGSLPSFDQYRIKELDMTLSIPSYAYCTGADVPANYPPLERMGISAEKLESNYRSRGIFFNAVWFDDGADVVEIVAAGEDVSDYANSLARFSEYELEQLRQSFLLYGIESPDLPRYYDVSVVTIGKQPYIRALGQDRSGSAYHVQYMTIINGKRIKLSLIEHYTETEMPEDGLIPAHIELMDSIARSVKYGHVRSQFVYNLSKLRFTAWLSIFGIFVLLAYGVKYVIDQRKLAEQQLAQDHEALYGGESGDGQDGGTEGSGADESPSDEPEEIPSEESDASPEQAPDAAEDGGHGTGSAGGDPDGMSENEDEAADAGSPSVIADEPGPEDGPDQ